MIRRIFCALIACLCIGCGALAENPMNGLVRLHVVADDNSADAQTLKLQLRNSCLRCARACLHDAENANAAYMRLQQHLPDFQSACEERARELGYTGPIKAEAGIFPFPRRSYGKTIVPAGNYRALRITIGDGGGRNWWCILYPTLCTLDESAGDDPEGIVAWLRSLLGR